MEKVITLRGQEFRAKKLGFGAVYEEVLPIIIKFYGDNLKAFLRQADPSDDVDQQLAQSLRSELSQAMMVGIGWWDLVQWMTRLNGAVYIFWMSIRDNHPERTLEKTQQFLSNITHDELLLLTEVGDHAIGRNPTLPEKSDSSPESQTTNPSDGGDTSAS